MAEIRKETIRSLGELLDKVTPTRKDSASGRLRDYAVYRGVANVDWDLLTSLDRLGGVEPPHTKSHLEKHIFRNFVRYSRPYLDRPPQNEWELLVIGQHHGLPTRLLDWSYSPLAAAHFATLEASESSARVVWKLDWKVMHTHFDLPDVALLSEELLGLLQERGIASAMNLFEEEGQVPPFACLLEPPTLDNRIVVQSGVFTLCSSKKAALNTFLINTDLAPALTKFVIPKGSVDKIRDQLDLCSIDERRLFPDLDGVAAEMLRYYSPS